MSIWFGELRKDVRMMRTFGLVSIACVAVIGVLLIIQSYRSPSAHFPIIGIGVLGTILVFEMFYLPVHLVINIVREWRGSAGFWLQSPQSGWLLMASKAVSSCLWTIALQIVTAAFMFWSFYLASPYIRALSPSWVGWLTEHQYLLGAYAIIGVLLSGLSMGLWLMLICIVMRSLRYRVKGLPWLAALIVFLIPTWGMSSFAHTYFYHRILDVWQIPISWFGIGNFPLVAGSGSLQASALHLNGGQLLWNVVVLAVVFYLSGWLLDKRVEI